MSSETTRRAGFTTWGSNRGHFRVGGHSYAEM